MTETSGKESGGAALAPASAATPVVRVYAKALLDAAEKTQQAETALEELESLLREVVDTRPDFAEFLRSGIVGREHKETVLQRVLEGRVSLLVLRFLLVLNQHQRLDLLRWAVRAFREMLDERRGRVPVQLTSAVALDEETLGAVRDRLAALLQKAPVLTARVEPATLGGLVVRVGDSVYDGSVATQLRRLRDRVLKRSIYEIQSGRNRFRDSAGD